MSSVGVTRALLGAFPMVIQGLEQARELMKRAGVFKHIQLEHNKCLSDLGLQRLYFRAHMERLLFPSIIDDAEIQTLLEDPTGPSWEEQSLADALESRLGDGYQLYRSCIVDMKEVLEQVEEELQLSSDSVQSQLRDLQFTDRNMVASLLDLKDKEKRDFQRFRLRFSSPEAEERRDSLLAQLNDYNAKLEKLLTLGDQHRELTRTRASKQQSNADIEKACNVWRSAAAAFRGLASTWGCDCPRHETNLVLKHHTDTHPNFDLLLPGWNAEAQMVRKMKMMEITGQSHALRQISDLCVESGGSWVFGFLVHENRKYSIDCQVHSFPKSLQYMELAQILDAGSAYLLTVRERLAAALVLASSFVQLFSSPWLQTLAKDEIMFLQEDESMVSLSQPLLGRNTAPCALGRDRQPNRPLVHAGAEALDQLGILLLELHFGTPIKHRPERKIYRTSDSEREQAAFDVIAARVWQNQLSERNYAEAVAWCLGGNRHGVDWSVNEDGSTADAWRFTMMRKVVEPLKRTQEFLVSS